MKTLEIEKEYWEQRGFIVETVEEDNNIWLSHHGHALPTIIWSDSKAFQLMSQHKINIEYFQGGCSAWHPEGSGTYCVNYSDWPDMAHYYVDNIAILKAVIDKLKREKHATT